MNANDLRAPALSPSQKAQFDRHGFIGPFDGSVPGDVIDRVAYRLAAMIDERWKHPLYGRFSVRDWHLLDDEVLALFRDPAVLGRMKALLGEDLILWRSKVFDKQPGEGVLGWHQEWGAFNGEEIGNDVPGLEPAPESRSQYWNLTAWIALVDIDESMGPIRFALGSHRRHYPITMAPLTKTEFWHDPFLGVSDPQVLVKRANEGSLILDVDTTDVFEGMDTETLSLDRARDRVLYVLSQKVGALTLDFDASNETIVNTTMRKGQFVIFSERTMHGSSANQSSRRRLAINGRVTHSSTIVYPGRLRGNYVDGSNIDISKHRCILLAGEDRAGVNVFEASRFNAASTGMSAGVLQ
ncbi:MAG TPA: phytanoyl-CoA dioxygenase family protein [Gemmataceae bacterium]|jgi:non-heme Fe2+,alpha-ketoglutarate-dependent halogenase|nr:phytanoyl-CoA dioxygenase family protein [Gemmataceae bacterium]